MADIVHLTPGSSVTWLERIPAIVVSVGIRRVTIAVPLKAGGYRRVAVKRENLTPSPEPRNPDDDEALRDLLNELGQLDPEEPKP